MGTSVGRLGEGCGAARYPHTLGGYESVPSEFGNIPTEFGEGWGSKAHPSGSVLQRKGWEGKSRPPLPQVAVSVHLDLHKVNPAQTFFHPSCFGTLPLTHLARWNKRQLEKFPSLCFPPLLLSPHQCPVLTWQQNKNLPLSTSPYCLLVNSFLALPDCRLQVLKISLSLSLVIFLVLEVLQSLIFFLSRGDKNSI